MVFRRDNKGGDAFQRQISALRQQLGGNTPDDYLSEEDDLPEEREDRRDYRYAEPVEPQPGYATYGRPDYPEYDERRPYADDTGEDPAYERGLQPVSEPSLPAIPSVDQQTTVVSHDTTWKGEISSEGSMHIHGRFDGNIRAREDVYILEEATVEATIDATNIVIGGRFNGLVKCLNRLEVLPSGRVSGEITAPILVVHDGAVINGQVRMEGSDAAPAEPAALIQRRSARGSA